MDSALIRDASEQDLPALCALMEQLSHDDASRSTIPGGEPAPPVVPGERERKAFHDLKALPGARVLVVERGGRIAGTAVLFLLPRLYRGGIPLALLDAVVVERSARSTGCGTALLRRCLEEAKASGAARLVLASNERRAAAHRFYERLGFCQTGRSYTLVLG